MRCTWLRISMVPFEILVAIDRAWKKDVFSGPRPVFWGGTNTSMGAIAPALAGAFTCIVTSYLQNRVTTTLSTLWRLALFSRIKSRTSVSSSEVNTNPTLPLIWGSKISSWGFLSRWPRIAFLIVVFLPIIRTPWPRNDVRICCICFDPTLSTFTMKRRLYSSNKD